MCAKQWLYLHWQDIKRAGGWAPAFQTPVGGYPLKKKNGGRGSSPKISRLCNATTRPGVSKNRSMAGAFWGVAENNAPQYVKKRLRACAFCVHARAYNFNALSTRQARTCASFESRAVNRASFKKHLLRLVFRRIFILWKG